ncbi:DUF3090 domain-containing protein [Herbiconiux flava]|uniref:Putative repeat protein (TIGR03847 family) n=1 Tax=Herbiconiux flava TaxID=881268 RepID=A0A852STG1_9MICO|nr:DUF3090 domain-containing protein [Herbiconiux flava]NYD72042.1 putative repeat protein (TIGR03847 family) [Herbiconiux flava]GLK17994.1 hypothetical protein GCM10017602_24760 [Herbiconiux flava]
MPTIVHDFAWPDRVVVGTVGHPGSRTFYLQARTGAQLVSVALEKEQSAVLAEKIDEILDELMVNDGNRFSVPSTIPVELVDNEPLEPVFEQFRAGAMGLGWDPTTAQLVVEAYPLIEAEPVPDDPAAELEWETGEPMIEPAELLVVRMPVGTARAFAKRTREIVGAGRPLCPLCGSPMDPEGHVCPVGDDV